MPEFKFRFATLLKLREAVRDARQAELNEAHQAAEVVRENLAQVGRDIDALRAHAREAASSRALNVDRLMESQRYELVLRVQQRQCEQQAEAVEAEIARRQEVLIEANREVRVLEKLRERLRERFRQEEERRLMAEIDEVAQRRTAAEVDA